MTFFVFLEFCYWTKVKTKYVFLAEIMLLHEVQVFFFFMFFCTNVFQVKLDNVFFLFKLTSRRTNYQTIKFLQLYLQYSKRKEK